MQKSKTRVSYLESNTNLVRAGLQLSLLTVAIASSLVGCGSDNNSPGSGTLSVYMTDAPIDDAKSVNIVFTGLEIQPGGADEENENEEDESGRITVEFDEPQTLDLLQVQGANSTLLLDGLDLPAGRYSWIRLQVSAEMDTLDSTIVFEGGTEEAEDDEVFSLYIPSGSESGLKLNRPFTVSSAGTASFTIDFDLRKSVKGLQGNDYRLRPTLRIIDNQEMGHIDGLISSEIIADPACADGLFGVYLYAGEPAVLDDIGSAAEPLTATSVTLVDGENGLVGEYEIGFLEPGDYTVGLTCQANLDDPELDDEIAFLQSKTVTVAIDNMNTVDFP